MPAASVALRFSRALALAYAILLPIAETVRRWKAIDYWPAYLDDWVIAILLFAGFWASDPRRSRPFGRAALAAAWGFACGLGYASFFGNLRDLHLPASGTFSREVVVTTVGLGWLLALLAAAAAIRAAGVGAPDARPHRHAE